MFSVASSVVFGLVMFEHNCYPIYFLLLLTNFIYIKSSSRLSSLNDASVNIVHNEGSFEFSPKAEFTSRLYIHTTLVKDTEAESPHCAQQLQPQTC